MKDQEEQEARIRAVYATRDAHGRRTLADPARPENRLWLAGRHRTVRALLAEAGWSDLRRARILDVGCGAGDWLRTLAAWGADPALLHGIDLLDGRIQEARAAQPQVDFRVGSGWSLPFDDGAMDLVFAQTVFSSIIDAGARVALAREMARVLALRGHVLVYDFRVSHPRNRDTVGVGAKEIIRLFPGRPVTSRSLTLAPPVARPVARVSAGLARGVEALLPFLRTHLMHRVDPPSP